MKTIFITVILCISSSVTVAFAAPETCYQVSTDNNRWSRTPESLCLMETGDGGVTITLKSGMLGNAQEIARFNMTLISSTDSINHNGDIYGVANPANSSFNALAIKFHGEVDRTTRTESGSIYIGKTKLYYRTYPR